MFFLIDTEEPLQKILYDSCPHCKDLEAEQLPHIELRRSVKLNMKERVIMYDNRVYIMQQGKELLQEQYHAMKRFIGATKT